MALLRVGSYGLICNGTAVPYCTGTYGCIRTTGTLVVQLYSGSTSTRSGARATNTVPDLVLSTSILLVRVATVL